MVRYKHRRAADPNLAAGGKVKKMKTWLDDPKQHLFEVTEYHRGRKEVWHMRATNKEMLEKEKLMRKCYGYVRGVGGDTHYECVVVQMDY